MPVAKRLQEGALRCTLGASALLHLACLAVVVAVPGPRVPPLAIAPAPHLAMCAKGQCRSTHAVTLPTRGRVSAARSPLTHRKQRLTMRAIEYECETVLAGQAC